MCDPASTSCDNAVPGPTFSVAPVLIKVPSRQIVPPLSVIVPMRSREAAVEVQRDAGLGRQVGGGGCNRLDARLLIVRDDRHRLARLLFRRGFLLQDLHLAINAQHRGHLFRKVGVAAFNFPASVTVASCPRPHLWEP